MYYVLFIDDFSKNTWIYLPNKKSKVFDRFKEFKALAKNQTKKKIKVPRTDNGGENITQPNMSQPNMIDSIGRLN